MGRKDRPARWISSMVSASYISPMLCPPKPWREWHYHNHDYLQWLSRKWMDRGQSANPSFSISLWISPLSRALRRRKSSQTLCPKLSKPIKGFLFIFFTPVFQCDHLCQTPFKAFSFHMAGCQKDLNYFQDQGTTDHATAQASRFISSSSTPWWQNNPHGSGLRGFPVFCWP